MIFNKAIATKRIPSLIELEHAVKRNFGGLEDFDTWSYFHEELRSLSFEVELIDSMLCTLLFSIVSQFLYTQLLSALLLDSFDVGNTSSKSSKF